MERASRLIVIASIVLAGVTHAWLASAWQPSLPAAAAAAFALALVLARASLGATLALIFAVAYVTPALFSIAFGSTDYHLTLVWLAALAGAMFAHTDFTRWHLPTRWSTPLVWWALVVAVTWPIVAARELDFSLVAARTYDTQNALFAAPPRVAAGWVVINALGQMIGILWIDLLWARFRASLHDVERYVIVPILAGTAIGAAAGLYQALVDVKWMNELTWYNMGRSAGLMFDANTFGIGAAIWGPVAVALAWRLRWPVWSGVVLCALLAAGMWTSDSRTALIAFVSGVAGLIVAVAQRRGVWEPKMAPIAALLGAAVIVLLMAIAPRGLGESSNPVIRILNRIPPLELVEIQRFASELWNRFDYGRAASRIVVEHPLTGVGVGAFHVVALDYIYRYDKERILSADNAQNWWRHQLAELGIVGAFPSLWLSLVVFLLLWRGGPATEPVGVTTVLRTVLIGVGMASLLGVPTQHPATWLSFATILFWLAAMYDRAGAQIDPHDHGDAPAASRPANVVEHRAWMVAIAVAAATAAGQAASARGDLRVPVRALVDGVRYRYGFTPPEGPSQYGPLRWAAARAVEVMPADDQWLQLAIWADTSEPVTVRVWMNQRRVIEESLRSTEPSLYYVRAPDQQKWIMLELSASRAADEDHALRVAQQWVKQPPAGAPPERTIR